MQYLAVGLLPCWLFQNIFLCWLVRWNLRMIQIHNSLNNTRSSPGPFWIFKLLGKKKPSKFAYLPAELFSQDEFHSTMWNCLEVGKERTSNQQGANGAHQEKWEQCMVCACGRTPAGVRHRRDSGLQEDKRARREARRFGPLRRRGGWSSLLSTVSCRNCPLLWDQRGRAPVHPRWWCLTRDIDVR